MSIAIGRNPDAWVCQLPRLDQDILAYIRERPSTTRQLEEAMRDYATRDEVIKAVRNLKSRGYIIRSRRSSVTCRDHGVTWEAMR